MILEKSEQFDFELEEIVNYIALDSPTNALKFYDDLIEKIYKIVDNPKIYRAKDDIENVRELIFKGYTIPFYEDYENDKIIVLGIFNRNLWDYNVCI